MMMMMMLVLMVMIGAVVATILIFSVSKIHAIPYMHKAHVYIML